MAYKSKFLHFKTKASYNAERAKTTAGTEERKVFDAYISFIDEGPMICTWGKEYKCDISASEVEALVNAGKISPATVAPLIAGTAAVGTSTKYAREDHRHPAQTTVSGNAGTATKLATPRVIAIAGAVSGSATFDGSSNVSINSTLNGFDASKITSGTISEARLPNIPIEKLPAGALERMFVVESQTAAIDAVKAGTIQEGDVVQIGSKGLMYFCIDDAATTFGNAFKEFTAGSATSVPWSGVTNAPTKLSQFSNDAGYLTSVPAQTWASITGKPSTFTPSAHTQSYTTLTGSTTTANQAIVSNGTANGWTLKTLGSLAFSSATIPTKTSQLTNDSGFLTSVPAQSWASITGKPTFATVATSGSYNDLSNKPTIPSLSGYATQSWVTSQGYLTSIPVATSSAYGGIQIGYTTSGKNYAVQLSNGKAYVNVPWTDTNTTYTSGTNISISGTTINCTYSYSLPTATSSVLGGVKVGSNITLSSGTISLSKSNVTSALGYTPANTNDIPEIPIALPNPYALTINGTSYTGSSAVSINTARILSTSTLSSSTVSAGYSYNNTLSRTISSLSGFSSSNPDSVIISTARLAFTASNAIKMNGLADLSGTYYIYCLSYMANGKVAVNGAVYV